MTLITWFKTLGNFQHKTGPHSVKLNDKAGMLLLMVSGVVFYILGWVDLEIRKLFACLSGKHSLWENSEALTTILIKGTTILVLRSLD